MQKIKHRKLLKSKRFVQHFKKWANRGASTCTVVSKAVKTA